ncbi:hypothetical protein PENFLA_c019G03557 [Penicillium flavigenum]|uniref:Uncharacterized protein n=1 Tax=Penicillium flavigenum TaxID=254877 RepID=A0A1V6SYW6_9EURO|nr:hypothetical protein PENFLA_c019G03557 [Penicillium flavigenum]
MADAEKTKLSSTIPMAGPASASASCTDTNADEAMRLAIAHFRSRMAAANQKFLQDCVSEIEAKGLATEEEKRRRLWQYRWMDDIEWDDEDPETRQKRDCLEIPQQTSVNDLDIPAVLNALPSHQPADGVVPSRLRTEQWRQMYLDTVQRVCQRQADAIVAELDVTCNTDEDHGPVTIPRCDELGLFVKYAQAVVDVDFRLSGIAGFRPASWTGVRDEELDGLDEGQRRDKLADPELLKREQEALQRELEDEFSNECLEVSIDRDLEVRAGFITGIGYHQLYGCPVWYSSYVYCRLWDNDEGNCGHEDADIQDATNIRDWGWRVAFFTAELDNPTVLYGRKARFDSIPEFLPEFLDWYASWLDHLHARGLLSLRRKTKYIRSVTSKPNMATLNNQDGLLKVSLDRYDQGHIVEKVLQWRGLAKSGRYVEFEEDVAPIG